MSPFMSPVSTVIMDRSRSTVIMDLPQEVLMDILLRIPIKTISAGCRLVCKTWFNIISDPMFTHQLQLHTKSHPCLFLRPHTTHDLSPSLSSSSPSSRTLYLVDLETDQIKLNTTFKLPKYDANIKLRKLTVVNSCNGLLCLCHSAYHIIVFNPLTGEQMTLPKSTKVENIKAGTDSVFGFGFSSRTNQYKVVRVVYQNQNPRRGKSGLARSVAQVHTLGTRSWRTIQKSPLLLCNASYTTFLNGVIHWLLGDHPDSSDLICCFDVRDEEFGSVSPPWTDYFEKDRSLMSMGVLGESLCICDTSFNSIDIWVMNEYGVQESWTRHFQINLEMDYYPTFICEPIKYLTNGELVVLIEQEDLVFCDPVKNDIRSFKIQRNQSNFETIVHVPNFISLKDECRIEDTDMGHATHLERLLSLSIGNGFEALSLLEGDLENEVGF